MTEEDLAKRIEKLLATKNPRIIKTVKKKSGKLAVAQVLNGKVWVRGG